MKPFFLILCTVFFAYFLDASSWSKGLSKVVIQSKKLSERVYMLEGAGGNIGLIVGDNYNVLIDDQFAPLTAKIETAVAKISKSKLRYVINTHWHGDHTGGNENLGRAGAIIVAHKNVRQRMSTAQVIKAFGKNVPASPDVALPVITFVQEISFYIGGEELQVFHVKRAHTDGDAIIHFKKSNVIHMGDVFFNGNFPFIDNGSGGSITGIIEATEKGLSLSDELTKIIPGHGKLADRSELKAYLKMLRATYQAVKKLKDAGNSLAKVKKTQPLKKWSAKWGGGFISTDKFTEIIYNGL